MKINPLSNNSIYTILMKIIPHVMTILNRKTAVLRRTRV